MGLDLDSLFIKHLQKDTAIGAIVDDRIYDTSIELPDSELDNVPLPYIIVSLDGVRNGDSGKDFEAEGDEDLVDISIDVVASTREQLADLAQLVRTCIFAEVGHPDVSWSDFNEYPTQYDFNASAIQYDPTKPCYWQTLSYHCTVKR